MFNPASVASTPNNPAKGPTITTNGAPSRKPVQKADFVVVMGMYWP
jgi:hypothetical protein